MAKKDYITNQTLFGKPEIIGFGSEEFFIREIERNLSNKIIIKNHYSGKVTMSVLLHLGLYIDKKLEGVLQFGHAMNPKSVSNIVEGTETDMYLELNRMWLSDIAPRNSESMAISYCLKYIKGKYPKIKWIQSFADERCNCYGVVYQACNFNFYGEHENIFWELDGIMYHNKAMTIKDPTKSTPTEKKLQANKHRAKSHLLKQFRYIYFIDKRWKQKCLLKEKPYPKHYDNSNGFEKTEAGRAFKKYGRVTENVD